LAIGARSEDFLRSVAKEIEALGQPVIARRTDLADQQSCESLVTADVDTFGGVDILVQNGHDTGDMGLIENADVERWRQAFDCNMFGALNLFKACLPSMKQRGDGRVIL